MCTYICIYVCMVESSTIYETKKKKKLNAKIKVKYNEQI